MDNQAASNRFAQFQDYYDELLSYLTVRLRSRDQAMDVTQETFLRVLAQDSPVPVRQPRAFLYKTAVNLTVDLFRKKRRWPEDSLDTKELQPRLVVPARQEAQVESNEQMRRLHEPLSSSNSATTNGRSTACNGRSTSSPLGRRRVPGARQSLAGRRAIGRSPLVFRAGGRL